MTKLRGLLLLIPSILVALIEVYFIIIEPILNGINLHLTNTQYWAIAIPVATMTTVFAIIGAWIGYTMIVTPEPIRFTYEEAYEDALNEINKD